MEAQIISLNDITAPQTTAGDACHCFLSVMVALCHLGASLGRGIVTRWRENFVFVRP
jgi:hypothetical protein